MFEIAKLLAVVSWLSIVCGRIQRHSASQTGGLRLRIDLRYAVLWVLFTNEPLNIVVFLRRFVLMSDLRDGCFEKQYKLEISRVLT